MGCLDVFNRRIPARYRVMVGAVFIVLPIGIPWYFGNLATYTTSYFRFTTTSSHANTDDVDPTWMLSVFFIGLSTGHIASGALSNKIGRRNSFLVSSLLFDVGIFTTYFSVRNSVALTLLTFMAIPGFFSGVILALAFSTVADWFSCDGQHVGAASSVVSVAFSTGALVYNEMTTRLINPDNLAPDWMEMEMEEGAMVYFSQAEIIDRYPYVFIAIGIVSVVFQGIAAPLLVEVASPPPPPLPQIKTEDDSKDSNSNSATATVKNWLKDVSSYDCVDQNEMTNLQTGGNSNSDTKNENYSKEYKSVMKYSQSITTISKTANINSSNSDEKSLRYHGDMTPTSVIKTKSFHVLWFSSFVMAFGYLAVNNYYKLFGQIWIDDDSFLATTGSMATVSGAVMRVGVGIAADKFGLKPVFVLISASNCVCMSWWYLSARQGKWLYLVLTDFLSGLFSCSFVLFPVATVMWFGHAHYPTHYGLVMSSTLLANVMAPLLFPVVLTHLGWSPLFSGLGIFNGMVVLAVIVFLPSTAAELSEP